MHEVGIAKRDNVMEIAKLEAILRDDLNKCAERRMAVLEPLKVIITNYEDNKVEELDAINNPEDELPGTERFHSVVSYI
jgi:glutaminyl-tRNA synthetase